MAGIHGAIEGYTLVAHPSRRGQNPLHLKPYQKKLGKAAREAAAETVNLRGAARVARMNQLVREKLTKGGQNV